MLFERAEELGRLIGQTNEAKALRRAEEALRNDEVTRGHLEKMQTIARQMDQAMAQGQMPEEGAAQTYEEAVREFELSPIGQGYIVARTNFEKVMARVNEEMAKGIEKGATSSIITLG
ncbi:MAG TPA: YlbF family regulator [Gemmatimonadales bacterium]|nr:YlbF family regulator [Gemmatimonadales bacterium]